MIQIMYLVIKEQASTAYTTLLIGRVMVERPIACFFIFVPILLIIRVGRGGVCHDTRTVRTVT